VKVGSLFTGYGGLDMAVGGDLAWYSEIDYAANTVLENHYPNIPNIGDITNVDWSTVEPVDVITGGYPCQPFSTAGKRKGENDERHLWPYVRDAIGALGPQLVILENVRGHLTLGFGTVLGEIADLGYSARWGVVRASDAGSPHGRPRIFLVAYPTNGSGGNVRFKKPKNLETSTQSTTELGECFSKDWGRYSKSIRKWEIILGRNAPSYSVDGKINPKFCEWMMGLPDGWVTDFDLPYSDKLKMLGNGVIPQQAKLALELLGVYSER
jgi:DNA (cytosine-5)-methyltransferase 1